MKIISDLFSRRDKKPTKTEKISNAPQQPTRKALTKEFRNRVIQMCHELFGYDDRYTSYHEFWEEIHQQLRYQQGTQRLSSDPRAVTPADDAIAFLLGCPDANFLDFVEYLFRTECFSSNVHTPWNDIVQKVNQFFAFDSLPYELTKVIWRDTGGDIRAVLFATTASITSWPKVIPTDSMVVHQNAVGPALVLLSDSAFEEANREFVTALEDYRKRDYSDCLVKCGSAFESVMKVICDKKGWPYNQNDTASPLLKTIIANTGMETFFEAPLILIATMRNKLSIAHGAGVHKKSVPQHVAQFAINITASAIVFLTEATQ